jgi:hypothetical protein
MSDPVQNLIDRILAEGEIQPLLDAWLSGYPITADDCTRINKAVKLNRGRRKSDDTLKRYHWKLAFLEAYRREKRCDGEVESIRAFDIVYPRYRDFPGKKKMAFTEEAAWRAIKKTVTPPKR